MKKTIWLIAFVILSTNLLTWAITRSHFKQPQEDLKKQKGITDCMLEYEGNKIENIRIQLPFVEDTNFIMRWDKTKITDSDSSLAYETYCRYLSRFVRDVTWHNSADTTQYDYGIKNILAKHSGFFGSNQRNYELGDEMYYEIDSLPSIKRWLEQEPKHGLDYCE